MTVCNSILLKWFLNKRKLRFKKCICKAFLYRDVTIISISVGGKKELKKFICGIILCVIGLMFSFVCFIRTLYNPFYYNGREGLLASFLGNNTLLPFIIFMLVLIAGVSICIYEAYKWYINLDGSAVYYFFKHFWSLTVKIQK